MVKKSNAVLYGIFAGMGLLAFYLTIVSLFQSFDFALANLRSLWYLIFPLAAGFGTQIGLFLSVRHTAQLTGTVAGTGAISGGSMLACCSHFLLQMIPLVGASGLAIFLVKYQAWFLGVGILSNVIGITLMIRHKNSMRNQRFLKHSNSNKSLNTMKGGSCH